MTQIKQHAHLKRALQLQPFFVMVDLGWEREDETAGKPEHRVLVHAKAFRDGSLEIRPRLDGTWHRFHDREGALYEYSVAQHQPTPAGDQLAAWQVRVADCCHAHA